MMSKEKDIFIPDIFESGDIPFFQIKYYENSEELQFEKLTQIRNITHRLSDIMSKVYSYWIQKHKTKNQNGEQQIKQRVLITYESPLIHLQDFIYLLNHAKEQNIITHSEWQNIIRKTQIFKDQCTIGIRQQFMAESQINFKKNNYLDFYVYSYQSYYAVKAHLKTISFEIGSHIEKQKCICRSLIIQDQQISELLTKKKQEKLQILKKTTLSSKQTERFNKKYEKFYEKNFQSIDQKILELQVYYNFPLLRVKNFIPVFFKDNITGEQLKGPIVGNSNNLCMYSHFHGYNTETSRTISGKNCEQCGIIFQHEFKRNMILEFLRDNYFNISHQGVLYCPEYNRFKLIKNKDSTSIHKKGKQLVYYNYLHLKINLKKISGKERIRIKPIKNIEQIKVIFRYKNQSLLIRDPVRGKKCNHYQFADLRLFYEKVKVDESGFVSKILMKCPICEEEMQDTELIYLAEMNYVLQYCRQVLFDEKIKDKNKFIEKEEMKIQVDHNHKKVILIYSEQKDQKFELKEIQISEFYQKIIDPYVHFSQLKLGLKNRKKQKRNNKFYFGIENTSSDQDNEEVKYQRNKII